MPLQEGARPLDGVEEAHASCFRSLPASPSSARNVVASMKSSTKSVKGIVWVGAPAGGVDIVSVVYCVGGLRGKVRREAPGSGPPDDEESRRSLGYCRSPHADKPAGVGRRVPGDPAGTPVSSSRALCYPCRMPDDVTAELERLRAENAELKRTSAWRGPHGPSTPRSNSPPRPPTSGPHRAAAPSRCKPRSTRRAIRRA